MSFAAYTALPGINWSTLKHGRESMLHYRHALTAPHVDTTSRMMGRALHTLVLEPELFGAGYAVWDGERRGKVWTDFRDAHAGRTILRDVELDLVRAQAAAVRAHPAAMRVLEGRHEVALQWTDAATGLACKGLADSLSPGFLADLKGTGSLGMFERLAWRDGYAHQLAWYLRGARALGLDPRPCLVAVGGKPPHDVGVFLLPDTVLSIADRDLTDLLARVAECLQTDVWPGAYPEPVELAVPAWALDAEIEIESEEVTSE